MYIFYSSNINLLLNKKIQLFSKGEKFFSYQIIDFQSIDEIFDYVNQEKLFCEKECLCFITTLDNLLKEKEKIKIIKKNIEKTEQVICFFIETDIITIDDHLFELFSDIQKVDFFSEKSKELLIKLILQQKKINCTEKEFIKLCQKLPNDELIIKNEMYKLCNSSKLDLSIINDYKEYNLFKVIEYWLNSDFKNLIGLLNQSFETQEQTILLFNFLVKKISEFYFVKKMVANGLSLQEISQKLKCNFYVLKNDWNRISHLPIITIQKILYNLYNIEKNSRIYQIDIRKEIKELFLTKDSNGNKQ